MKVRVYPQKWVGPYDSGVAEPNKVMTCEDSIPHRPLPMSNKPLSQKKKFLFYGRAYHRVARKSALDELFANTPALRAHVE